MVSRMRCGCCALPPRLLQHVAAKAAEPHRPRIAEHHAASATIRSLRRARADEVAAAPPPARAAARGRRTVFDAGGKEKLPGRLVRREGAPPVADAAVNQAYENVGITLAFFSEVFGRDSLDGRGMKVDASVHYGDRFSNAMWTGREMIFGDGDGIHILGFAQSLDIVAHELAHAVTQHSVRGGLGERRRGGKIALAGDAGALDESFSDVFATLVKQWHTGEDVRRADWLVGEGVLAPHIGRAVRSLKEPGNPRVTYEADDQPRDMRGYVPGGDVHTNSGIPNHAFYLAARALGGRAWEHAGPIWYRALHALKPRATFRDAAQATIAAAAELFGARSKERGAVERAWRQVHVLP